MTLIGENKCYTGKISYDNTLWFNNILKCILLDKATMVLGMLSPAAFTPIT